jgi:hypothetical protein
MSTKIRLTMETLENANVPAMHEGETLRAEITHAGKRPVDLANAAGLTKAAITKWFKTERFSDEMWLSIKNALTRLHIEPSRVRQEERIEPDADLSPVVEAARFTVDQLKVLRDVIVATPKSREQLLWWIKGVLSGSEK